MVVLTCIPETARRRIQI